MAVGSLDEHFLVTSFCLSQFVPCSLSPLLLLVPLDVVWVTVTLRTLKGTCSDILNQVILRLRMTELEAKGFEQLTGSEAVGKLGCVSLCC